MDRIVKDYINFLSECKTERLCVRRIIDEAEKKGWKNIDEVGKLSAGDKVYANKMGKALMLFRIGKDPIENGMNILGAHIDSPRLDAKPNPIYEKTGVVYLNTHYYGGIKKYQWLAIPLSICGVVCLKDGSTVEIRIGDEPSDPVFCISDILPHLAYKQMEKKVKDAVDAENLDVIIGMNGKFKEDGESEDKKKSVRDAGKKRIFEILKKKYKISEDDLLSSELEVVPSGPARLMGFDESMILGYGQDDRVCAYASYRAFVDSEESYRTSCLLLSDKEEIGSYGATGMSSHLLDNAVSEVICRLQESGGVEMAIRRCLANSTMLSSDVNAAYDPLNADLYDPDNASNLGGGIVLNKYTGSRGKSGASDANPEFIAGIRARFDSDKVRYQFAELGKVEVGGGGTIALYAAEFGMNVIDAGVAVLSMHAPWEITSVSDFVETYKGYLSFLKLQGFSKRSKA
ncbi:MAG TPA: aminopeptidase [Spirochaetaceae bacterium]|nr:aminopeptidase [Spirochaetaceae bacterium]